MNEFFESDNKSTVTKPSCVNNALRFTAAGDRDHFIISTSPTKPDPETRRRIRSHVMRGKNAGKFRNPKNWTSRPLDPSSNSEPQRWTLVTPSRVFSELLGYGFGGDVHMKPYMRLLIYRAFTIVKPVTYGLQEITSVNPNEDKLFCFANLIHYPGILHSILFTAQAFHDVATGRPYGTVALHHLAKALRLLQESLNDRKKAVDISTMAVVTSLAMAAAITGDLETAAKHMDGLKKIVELRGGLQSLAMASMIEHKARSIDIALAVGLGHDLRFTQDDELSWSPQIARGRRAARRFSELDAALLQFGESRVMTMRLDPRLLNVWADLREFSELANSVTSRRGPKVPAKTASLLEQSVPHRLLRLGIFHEFLRICMLAYVKMLLIRLKGIGKKMVFLSEWLKRVLTRFRTNINHQLLLGGDPAAAVKLLLWGAFIAGVAIFDDSEEIWLNDLLQHSLAVLELRTWDDTRAVLKEFLWIDAVFDEPGRQLFQRLRPQITCN
ncbi:hypothetical protein C7999DRAFT_44144 [Corynascus novoguineensis]|uniref:Uncharacterized protein n=1 Tax=Corynascus novoguineensis TaxID=1126955 RepID=A0AAN7HLB6_9PEZI|nr:hypothetical protein C7999DRAFT_44144 [Corynascus novoguineensis]